MKIIIKPLGALVIAALVVSAAAIAIPRKPASPGNEAASAATNWGGVFFAVSPARMYVSSTHENLALSPIAIPDAPGGFTEGVEFTVRKPTPQASYGVQAGIGVDAPLRAGQELTLVFWGRTTKGSLRSRAVVERNTEPFSKQLEQDIDLTEKWTEFRLPFVVKDDLAAGSSAIHVHGGYEAGTYQFAGIRLIAN
jgi:hypothetical protein